MKASLSTSLIAGASAVTGATIAGVALWKDAHHHYMRRQEAESKLRAVIAVLGRYQETPMSNDIREAIYGDPVRRERVVKQKGK